MVSYREIWARRCERCLEQVPSDFWLAFDDASFDLCWKMLKNKKGKKLRYKGLIVVVSGIESLEVEPIAWLLEESTIWVSEEVCPLVETKVIGKAWVTKSSLLWEEPIPNYGLKGMG